MDSRKTALQCRLHQVGCGLLRKIQDPGCEWHSSSIFTTGIAGPTAPPCTADEGEPSAGIYPKTMAHRKGDLHTQGRKERLYIGEILQANQSNFLKSREKIIDYEIRSKVLTTAPLHAKQHAYRAGRSTNTALYQLTSEIRSSLDGGEVMLCAFLDIEGAFENTSQESLSRALETRSVAASVRRWIETVLRTRIAETTVSNTRIRVGRA